ncbi:hypothetical protein GUJ93_ZPchr0012g22141 [Zizania palustris]|uniref:Protein TIFY n=1 Tax=Zizania palustris TaxID=103762 RepID=A0A8J5WML8_ZIZPA|nr:hypothetical protein GUJ93_ZPchr0012g22141 [Zizania palustris]
MAAADFGAGRRRRFAVACGVLSRCVRAEAAGKVAVAALLAHPAAAAASTMLLMPGADVAPDVREEEEVGGAARRPSAQRTILYGGRVLVVEDFPSESAAELRRVAAGHGVNSEGGDLPLARKASLKRFMEKRRGRLAATAPYSVRLSLASKATNEDEDARCWLGLGTPGSVRAAR